MNLVCGGSVINGDTLSTFKKHTPHLTIICGKLYILGVLSNAHNASDDNKFLFLVMLCCVQGPYNFKHPLVKSDL